MESTFNFEDFKKSVNEVNIQKDITRILDNELQNHGIDWIKFYNGDSSQDEAVNSLLKEYDIPMTAKDLQTNFLNLESEGTKDAPVIVVINDDKVKMIDYVQSLRGDNLKQYVVKMTDNLQIAKKQTTPGALALQIYAAGISAVGALWGSAIFIAIQAGKLGPAAILAAIGQITLRLAIGTVILILLLVFIPFIILMEKEAYLMGFVLNRTDEKMRIGELYFNHGHMLAMSNVEDVEDLQHKIFCPARKIIKLLKPNEASTIDVEGAYMGIIFAAKTKYALFGVEGSIKLNLKSQLFPNDIHLGYCVPLISSNKAYISWEHFSTAEKFFEEKENEFKQDVEFKESNRKIESHINSKSGGYVCMISTIQDLTKKS